MLGSMNNCRRCGIPMEPKDKGAHEDGSPNQNYCHLCYQNGSFTKSDIIIVQIVDRVADILAINVSDGTILQEILQNLQGILRVGLNQYGSTESTI